MIEKLTLLLGTLASAERSIRESDGFNYKPLFISSNVAPFPIIDFDGSISRMSPRSNIIDDGTGPVPVPEALTSTGIATAGCNTQDPDYGYPDCMPWTVYNGKILFRLSGYEYGRTRANDACQAMGGWLAIPFTEQDNLDINNFLDAALGEPNDLVLAGATAGTESWFAPMANIEVVNGVQQLMWFGQQCRGFHLCTHFRDKPSSGFWDDCPDCPQCDTDCPVIPTYTYTGFTSPDSPQPNCMMYKILTDPTVAFGNEYFWNEANCDRKIPALCEIDLKEVGCNAFGVENISSPKWKVDCTTYEHCVAGTIVMGICPPGTLFNQFADPPECQDPLLVEDCNVNECETGEATCDPVGICEDTIGSYDCSCGPGFIEVEANGTLPDSNTTVSSHTCHDINECDDPTLFECVIDSGCSNTIGSYECICNEWLAPSELDADGYPVSCIDDDECSRPDSCGPNTVCANIAPGFYCSCAIGFYDEGSETEQGAWDRLDSGELVNENSTYIPMVNGSIIIGDGTTCVDADECDAARDACPATLLNVCTNTPGSFVCECAPGTQYINETISEECEDIDECTELTFVCDPNAACVNDIMDYLKLIAGNMVTYSCQCRSGLNATDADGFEYQICENVDECAQPDNSTWADICGDYAICADAYPYYFEADETAGADAYQQVPYTCSCPEGFIVNETNSDLPPFSEFAPHEEQYAFTCSDRNECDFEEYGSYFCDLNNADGCANTIGSFSCSCSAGFGNTASGGCGDNNECSDEGLMYTCEGANSNCTRGVDCVQCVNTAGSYYCGCNDGWDYVGSYANHHRLEALPLANCTDCDNWNVTADGPCTACGPMCVNYNECLNGVSECGVGWTLTDILTGANVTCTDTTGSYYCTCPEGFYTADFNTFDNPLFGEFPPRTGVKNPNGGYDKKCYDIDECSYGMCGQPNQLCFNNIGSYECGCANGYEPTTYCVWEGLANETCIEVCIDINECDDNSTCIHTATGSDTCTNTDGSYICDCGYGYIQHTNLTVNVPEGDDAGTVFNITNYLMCEDINECDDKESYCHVDSNCNNTDGFYLCWCDDWRFIDVYGNGTLCEDLDECQGYNACNATTGSDCINHYGGYTCLCQDGYRPDGTYNVSVANSICQDIPECEERVDTCVTDAHEDTESFPWTLEEPYCSNSSEIEANNRCGQKASCINTPGSFECACNYPYTFGDGIDGGVGTGCNYPRECILGQHSCPSIADIEARNPDITFEAEPVECYEQPYFYQCRCTTGFFPLPDGQNCSTYDFSLYADEIEEYENNQQGLWCDDYNYTIGGDGVVNETVIYYACIDIDECASSQVDFCSTNADCDNTVGSYMCTCQPGWEGDGRTDSTDCSNINECDTGAHQCPTDDDSGECVDTEGSYYCFCKDGYKDVTASLNATECADCDECTDELHQCDGLATCENSIGSYDCACIKGYEGTGFAGDCNDIDECATGDNDCHPRSLCVNNIGSFECFCVDGYEGDGRTLNASFVGCIDTDECTEGLHNCNEKAGCINTEGSFTCLCDNGYLGNALNVTNNATSGVGCFDMDECDSVVDLCGVFADCSNTVGSYYCNCTEPGYKPAANGYDCEDIDECDALSCADFDACPDCDSNLGTCINLPGNYTCECQEGYNGTARGNNTCFEIDQCSLGIASCPVNATCVELSFVDGDYRCDCDEGFEKVNVYCRDIDECTNSTMINCDTNANCINTEGSFECECINGFTGDGVNCTNVDECVNAPTSPCSANATCTDNEGSYDCECKTGYLGDGTQCFDEDECLSGNHNCCGVSGCLCTNIESWYTCSCEDGFAGNGFLTSEVGGTACGNQNECLDGTHTCDVDNSAVCMDSPGGFTCACPSGTTGNGVKTENNGTSCVDIDECASCDPYETTCPCSQNAECDNTFGTYSCTCFAGFSGDGKTCLDINECQTNNGGCDAVNGECINTQPGNNCTCSKGWEGDGVTCLNINECLLVPNPCQNKTHSTCSDNDGSYDCICDTGYLDVSDECVDQEECIMDPSALPFSCSASDPTFNKCVNTDGSYECQCIIGYSDNNGVCEDEDECIDASSCQDNADCTNLAGTYECTCAAGYQDSADLTECIDVNECIACYQGSVDCLCGANTWCTNDEPGFTCTCLPGYVFAANGLDCEDINECDDNSHNCGDHSVCANEPGSFTCPCADGYSKSTTGDDTCVDTNECIPCDSDPRDFFNCPCPNTASCVNTDGGHECWCPLGWWMSEDECVDVDECDAPEYLAAQGYWDDASAAEAGGDFHEAGMTRRSADDPDAGCSDLENCLNNDGSFSCECIEGYQRIVNTTDCEDIDECALEGYCPSIGTTCQNTDGSFICECEPGFNAIILAGKLVQCGDVNECSQDPFICGNQATCANTFGGFNCQCLSGFEANPTGDGCVDIDECATGNHLCQQNFPLDCVNIEGSYTCQIPPGLVLDGKIVLDWLIELQEQLNRNNTQGTLTNNNTDIDNGFFNVTGIGGGGNDTFGIDSFNVTDPDTTLPPGVTNPPAPPGGNGTGDNGDGETSGDPHVRVATQFGTPVCFNFHGDNGRFVDLLSDPITGFEVNAEIKSNGAITRFIAVGVVYTNGGVTHTIRCDEDGVVIANNGDTVGTYAYADTSIRNHGDIELSGNHGHRAGVAIKIQNVAEFVVTFKDRKHKKTDKGVFIDDNHSMGFRTENTDGISHSATGIIGQFITPFAYDTIENTVPNFVVFHDRHVPAEVEFFHGLDYCLKVQDALVPTLLGNVVSAYYADSLFGVNDPANMADIMSP